MATDWNKIMASGDCIDYERYNTMTNYITSMSGNLDAKVDAVTAGSIQGGLAGNIGSNFSYGISGMKFISSQKISGGTIIGGLHYPADYVIYTDGTNYYAKNGETGKISSSTSGNKPIQYAINQLTDGGSIYIKKGTYPINSMITLKSNLTIIGEGYNTILQIDDNKTFSQGILFSGYGNSNINIENIHFDGNKDNQTTKSLISHICRSHDIRIDNCYFRNCPSGGSAILIWETAPNWGTTYNIVISDCIFELNDRNSIYCSEDANNIIINRNIFKNNGRIDLNNDDNNGDILITNTYSGNIIVSDNKFEGFKPTNYNSASVHARSLNTSKSHIIINGNIIEKGNENGILCYDCNSVNIKDNTIYRHSCNAIYLEGCPSSQVSNNILTYCKGNGIQIGSWLEKSGKLTLVEGNAIIRCDRGITSDSDYVKICNNIIKNCSLISVSETDYYKFAGILNYGNSGSITSNMIIAEEGFDLPYGISDKLSGDNDGHGHIILDNYIIGYKSGSMYLYNNNHMSRNNTNYPDSINHYFSSQKISGGIVRTKLIQTEDINGIIEYKSRGQHIFYSGSAELIKFSSPDSATCGIYGGESYLALYPNLAGSLPYLILQTGTSPYLSIDANTPFYLYFGGNEGFKFNYNNYISYLYGGEFSSDDLKLFPNKIDTFPYILIEGSGNITLYKNTITSSLSSQAISGGTVLTDLFKLSPQKRAGSTPTIGEIWMSGTSTVVGGLYCCTGTKWLKISLT